MTEERVPPPLEGPGFDVAWQKLEREDRRRITRAVRRGEPLDDPVDAAFAVRVARRDQSAWSLWGLALLGLTNGVRFAFSAARGDSAAIVFDGLVLVALSVLGAMLVRQRRRARESERRNLQLLGR